MPAVHTCTIAKSLGSYRAVLFRDGTPVHRGEWHGSRALADLDRRRFLGEPYRYAPAFLPAPQPRVASAALSGQLELAL